MNPINPPEAAAICRAIIATWPTPALDAEGIEALAITIHATGLPLEALEHGVTALRLAAPQFRPMAEIFATARRWSATMRTVEDDNRRRRSIEPGQAYSLAEHMAHLALVCGALRTARVNASARLGLNLASVESGTMRHVSTLLRVGSVDLTGAEPLASKLVEELLRRSETAEARS